MEFLKKEERRKKKDKLSMDSIAFLRFFFG